LVNCLTGLFNQDLRYLVFGAVASDRPMSRRLPVFVVSQESILDPSYKIVTADNGLPDDQLFDLSALPYFFDKRFLVLFSGLVRIPSWQGLYLSTPPRRNQDAATLLAESSRAGIEAAGTVHAEDLRYSK
jgi:hypothetical protein